MLAKAGSLEQNINHVEAFEMAMRDQDIISGASDIAGLQMSVYHRQRRAQNVALLTATHKHERTMTRTKIGQNVCRGCGCHQHGRAGSGDRSRMYPAWSQTCKECGKQNHFERVCQSKCDERRGAIRCIEDEETDMDALIAHVVEPIPWVAIVR